MYRPTVRYADIYKQYVDKLFHTTTMDRNQIMRAALFTAAHSPDFLSIIKDHRKRDVTLPTPPWKISDSHYWREQDPKTAGGDMDVNDDNGRKTSDGIVTAGSEGAVERSSENKGRLDSFQGRERTVPSRIQNGGIKIRIG